jgi:hypothetical protein
LKRRLVPWLAALVLVATALAVWLARPEPLDESAFGETLALAHNLPPLLLPGEETELAGRVTTHAGLPAADAFVVLERPQPFESGPAPLRAEYTDATGAFRFEALASGSYRVVLQHPSAPPRTFTIAAPLAGEIVWSLAEPLAPIEPMPTLVRGALAGRVTLPAGLAPRGDLAGYELVLTPTADTHPLAGAAVRRTLCDAEGRFAVPDLVLAEYDARVLPPWARGGSWPELARVRCAHRAAGTELALELTVGTLAGTLLEPPDRPLVGAVVRITSLSARDVLGKPQLWPPAVSDAEGRFRSELLPAGRYLLHERAGESAQDVEVELGAGTHVEVPFAPLAPRKPAR